jgi:uncharacterized protein (DUF2147 family)
MKKLLAIAALLLASTAAQAQYSFEYGGKTIRIDPDRGTVQIPGVYDNTRKEKRSKKDESDRPAKQPSQQAKTDPQPQAPPAVPPAAPLATVAPAEPAAALPPVPAPSTEPPTATAAVPPADTQAAPPPSPPPVQQDATPAAPPAPAPAPAVAAVPPAPPPVARPAAPAQLANSPIGVWLTEEKEGKVRIEQCGPNLCGYAVDKKSNQNGEQVLINMRPGKDKWSGRILDPNSGSTYDSTIALKGTDTLRVQGCAFGGMFCGGQTWSRVN